MVYYVFTIITNAKEWVDKTHSFVCIRSDVMKKSDVVSAVMALANPIAEANGCTIYDIEFKKEGSDYYLRICLDMAEEGKSVSLNECEAVSRALSDALDKADPIEQAYMLEVSSPGLDRALRTAEHFARFIGTKVDIGLYKAVNGAKIVTGTLISFEDNIITLETDGGEFSIPQAETTSVKLSLDGIF